MPMERFNQNDFNRFVLVNNAIGFFEEPITLKSGRKSSFYVNWRTVSEDVYLIDKLCDYVIAFVTDLHADGKLTSLPLSFYGVPEGATKLGILTQYKWAKACPSYGPKSHVLSMGRAKAKDHGVPKDRFFVGMPQGATIVLEDVTTTGLSIIDTIDKLIEADVHIVAALGLTDRMEKRDDGRTVSEAIAARLSGGASVPYFSLSQATTLLPEAVARKHPSTQILSSIRQEFQEFGVQELVL